MFYVANRINIFVPNAPFLYPLKTSENRKVFWCFQGLEKGCIGNKWVNPTGIYFFKVYYRNTETKYEICLKLTTKDSSVSKVDFKQVNFRWFNNVDLWAGCYFAFPNVLLMFFCLLPFRSALLSFILAFADSSDQPTSETWMCSLNLWKMSTFRVF